MHDEKESTRRPSRNHHNHQPSLTVECASLSHPRNPRARLCWKGVLSSLSLSAWSVVLYGSASTKVCAAVESICKVVFVFSRFIAQISTRMSESCGCLTVFVVAADCGCFRLEIWLAPVPQSTNSRTCRDCKHTSKSQSGQPAYLVVVLLHLRLF